MAPDTFTRGVLPYPPGSIILWHGDVNQIPHGWELCDGSNGTPDLIGRFLRMTSSDTEVPGDTGGANELTLSTAQLPMHSHTGTTTTDGEHVHQYEGGGRMTESRSGSSRDSEGHAESGQQPAAGAHSHTFETDQTGKGEPIDNQPEHVTLIPIQKQ